MTLLEAIENLDSLDENSTIYAVKPWTKSSETMVALESKTGDIPIEVVQLGMEYFLEVFIARDFVSDWAANLATRPSLGEKCERLIYYAIHDA